MRLLLVLCGVLPALACVAHAQPPQALPPPTGKERERIIVGIRQTYPAAPDRVVQIMADVRRALTDETPCEMVLWLAGPNSGVRADLRPRLERLSQRCAHPVAGLTEAEARARLGDRRLAVEVKDGEVVMIARSQAGEPQVCCSLQMRLPPVGGGYYAGRLALPDLDRAMLLLGVMADNRIDYDVTYRGPKAPPPPQRVSMLALKGQVLQRELRSQALGETRKLTVYLPKGWSAERRWPVLYLGDGEADGFAPMAEALIDAGKIRPIILVSAESGESAVVGGPAKDYEMDLRSSEYIRGFPGQGTRFERHMRFFAEELPAYAEREFAAATDRSSRAVAGKSNGGVLALWVGLMHPERFGAAVAMSPGFATLKSEDLRPGVRARFHLSAGLYELSFTDTARMAEAALRQAGYEVKGRYPAAGHASDQWELVLHDALLEIFPGGGAPSTTRVVGR